MTDSSKAGQDTEVITYMTYSEWQDIKDKMNERRFNKLVKERKRKAMYFRRQQCMGAVFFLVGLMCLITGSIIDNSIMQYFGGIIGLLGLYIGLTKQMILVDTYFLECIDRRNEY